MAGRWIRTVAGGDCEVDVCNGGGGVVRAGQLGMLDKESSFT